MKAIPWYVRALALALLVVGAFVGGRFSAPLQVSERVELKEDLELRAKYEAAISESETWRRVAERKTKTVKFPVPISCDGGVPLIAYREEQEQEERARADGARKRQEDHEGESDGKVSREAVREKIVTLRPDWRVTPLAGVLVGGDPIGARAVVGLGVERRVFGGLSAGALVIVPPAKLDQAVIAGSASFEF